MPRSLSPFARLWTALPLAALLAGPFAAAALAATPKTTALEGALTSLGGGPVADGVYPLTFAIYAAETGGSPVWSEGPLNVTTKNGQFSYLLGSKTPLDAATLSLAGAWFGVQVAADPELARRPLAATAYALRAAVAEALDCSGCLKAGALDAAVLQPYAKSTDLSAYAKAVDLSGYAKTSDLADYVKAAALAPVAASGSYKDLKDAPKLAPVATSGAYGDLANAPILPKLGATCGTGLVLRGLKADGSYDCIALPSATLPADGLSDVSNGLLTDKYLESVSSGKTPIAVPDGLPAGVSDSLNVPDWGLAQSLTVSVDLANSDITKVRITLYDPSGGSYKLYDQGGIGTALKGSWPSPDKTLSGDLTAWVGKNPKGLWSINVADLAGTNVTDGALNTWSITAGTVSSKKVTSNGMFIAAGGLKLPVAATHPVTCDGSQIGYVYVNTAEKAMYVCNGQDWFPLALAVSGSQNAPALHCKDLKAKMPTAPSGQYWIDPDGGATDNAYQAYCDMSSQGGGWTLVSRMTNGCMTDMNAAKGTLTSPSQQSCAKLSDAAINQLRAASGSDGIFWGWHEGNQYPLPASGRFLKIINGTFDASNSQGGLQQQCSCSAAGPWSGTYEAHSTMAGVYNHSSGGWQCVTVGQTGCTSDTAFTSGLFLYQHALHQAGTFPADSHGVAGGSNGWLFVR